MAVQIAKARGAYVYAVAGAASADFLTGLGVDEVIDYTTTDFVDAVTDLDVVFDVIGHDYPSKAVQALKPGGILVSTLPQSLPDVAESATGKGIRLAGLFVEADRLGMTELAKLVSDGRLQPVVAATFPLADAGQAQSSKAGPGKTVLTVVEDDS